MKQYQIKDFRKSIRVLERIMTAQLKDETICCGVTAAQCHVLLELEDNELISTTKLSNELGLDKSTVSRTIDSLVKNGLIERKENNNDRRYNKIFLTKDGKKYLKSINTKCNQIYKDILNYVPKDKIDNLIESVEILAIAVKSYKSNSKCC